MKKWLQDTGRFPIVARIRVIITNETMDGGRIHVIKCPIINVCPHSLLST